MTPGGAEVRVIVATEADLRRIVREELDRQRGEELLTPAEVAAITKRHVQTVREWLREGLPHRKAGQRKIVRRADLDAWMHRDKSAAHLRLLGAK